ncbi:MAG TPA: hypothetical protein PKI39_07415, partial [Synergistales bacterium]|nr:hypothetical protein [Synergistales bacterium]
MRNGRSFFFIAVLVLAALLAVAGLLPRIRAERQGNVAALVTDMRDVASLARESELTVPEVLDVLLGRGLTAVAVGELTGQELMTGALD